MPLHIQKDDQDKMESYPNIFKDAIDYLFHHNQNNF